MFTKTKIAVLIAVSILVTVMLYYIDSDPPIDNIFARILNTAIVFVIIVAIYCVAI